MKKELELLDASITLYAEMIVDCWANWVQPQEDINEQLRLLVEMEKETAALARHLQTKHRILEALASSNQRRAAV